MTTIPIKLDANNRVRRAIEGRRIASSRKTWGAGQAAITAVQTAIGATTSGAASAVAGEGAIPLDPAKTPKLRLASAILTNSVDPGATVTLRMRPFGSKAGSTSGGVPNDETATIVTGSTIGPITPGALYRGDPTEVVFDCPTKGWYVVEVVTTGTLAANAGMMTGFDLFAVVA